MIAQSINYSEIISHSPIKNINLSTDASLSKSSQELYEIQDDVGDEIAGNIVGKIVGEGATEAIGAVIGGEVGEIAGPAGVLIGAATGYVIGNLMGDMPHNNLPEAVNPNHYYAMGTGSALDQGSKPIANCNGSYYVNAYTCHRN